MSDRSEISRLQEALAAAEARLAETRKKALEEAAAIENRPPRTLGEAMLESPFQAVERYRAAIRSLIEPRNLAGEPMELTPKVAALQENSNG